jgi:protein-S-isoprenylcysteine O-methyltransferase Ste14
LNLPPSPAFTAVGAGAAALGIGILVSSLRIFHRAGTSVAPNAAASTLVTSGPYRISRNPIYLGFALISGGTALLARSAWALLLLPAVLGAVDRLVITREERYLATRFPRDYDEYRSHTRRWL